MSERSRPAERRLSTPLVLALASAMVSVGVIGYLSTRARPDVTPRAPRTLVVPTRVDRSTPAAAAESFLDAWRKRDHDTAVALSTGEARAEVEARRSREAAEATPEQELKMKVWDALARDRLTYSVEEQTDRSPAEVSLRGVARGRFMNADYARRIEFDLVRGDRGWTVQRMRLGQVLTDTPDLLQLPASSGR